MVVIIPPPKSAPDFVQIPGRIQNQSGADPPRIVFGSGRIAIPIRLGFYPPGFRPKSDRNLPGIRPESAPL